ncbi:hypothetical protein CYMTET_3727 [Cymbomonas tetramitiformis]|uniref:Uncharacterized protein n=1 Tax=Cymbomonas tetramitiformis TaxID=36881 RepID=A0AAE0H2W2_9CHLO|nr:hypothetical protein CYMTET_3727 [Cymbomonas tetramitiformis]
MERTEMVVMRTKHVKFFLNVLQMIRWCNNQVVTVKVYHDGVTFVSNDDSKSLQGTVSFRSQFFESFEFFRDSRHVFGLSLGSFVDSLGVFAANEGLADLTIKWPDSTGSVCLQSWFTSDDEYRPVQNTMYARVTCEEADTPTDYGALFGADCSKFLVRSFILKEAVDDLEWPAAAVDVTISKDPDRVTLQAEGDAAGGLEIELGISDEQTRVSIGNSEPVTNRYKHRHLKIATNIAVNLLQAQSPQVATTQVTIDEQGLMRIHHVMTATQESGATDEEQGGGVSPGVLAQAVFYINPEDILRETQMEP